MSEDSGLILQSFNINELAGATGLILGAVSGILVVVFKSRCYCKVRLGCSDNCNICMCERKPPPDIIQEDSDHEEESKEPKTPRLIPKKDKSEPEPEPELELP